jgi:hypothetical protein
MELRVAYLFFVFRIAYVYATRHFCRSPLSLLKHEDGEIEQVRRIISQLVPVLVDRKSKTLYTGLSEVITEMWSRIDSVRISQR